MAIKYEEMQSWWQELSPDIDGLLDRTIADNEAKSSFFGATFPDNFKEEFKASYEKGKEAYKSGNFDSISQWWNGDKDTGEKGFKDYLNDAMQLSDTFKESGIQMPSEKSIDDIQNIRNEDRNPNDADKKIPEDRSLFRELGTYKSGDKENYRDFMKSIPDTERGVYKEQAATASKETPELTREEALAVGAARTAISEMSDAGIDRDSLISSIEQLKANPDAHVDVKLQEEAKSDRTTRHEAPTSGQHSDTEKDSTVRYGIAGVIDDKVMLSNVDRIYENLKGRFDKDGDPKKDIEKHMGKAELTARNENWRIEASGILKDSSLSNEQKYERLAGAYKESFSDLKTHFSENRELFRGVWDRLDKMGNDPSKSNLKDFKEYMSKPEVKEAFTDAVKENNKDADAEKKVEAFYDSLEKAVDSGGKVEDSINSIRVDYDALTKKSDGDISNRPMVDKDPQKAIYLERAEKWETRKEMFSAGGRRNTFGMACNFGKVLNEFKAATGDEKAAMVGQLITAYIGLVNSNIIETVINTLIEGLAGLIIGIDKDNVVGKKDCIETIDKVSRAVSNDPKDVERNETDNRQDTANDNHDPVENEHKNDTDTGVSKGEAQEAATEAKGVEANQKEMTEAGQNRAGAVATPNEKSGKPEAVVEKQNGKPEVSANTDKDSLKSALTKEIQSHFKDYNDGKIELSDVKNKVDVSNADTKYDSLSASEKAECAKEALDKSDDISTETKSDLEVLDIYGDKDDTASSVTSDESTPEPVEVPEEEPKDANTDTEEATEKTPEVTQEEQESTTVQEAQPVATEDNEHAKLEKKESEDSETDADVAVAVSTQDDVGEDVKEHSQEDMDSAREKIEAKVGEFLEKHGDRDNTETSKEVADDISKIANEFGDNASSIVTSAFDNALDAYAEKHGGGGSIMGDKTTAADIDSLKGELNDRGLYQVTAEFKDNVETPDSDTGISTDRPGDTGTTSDAEFNFGGEQYSASTGVGVTPTYEEPPTANDSATALDNVMKAMEASGMEKGVEDAVRDVAAEEHNGGGVEIVQTPEVEIPEHDFGSMAKDEGVYDTGAKDENKYQPTEAQPEMDSSSASDMEAAAAAAAG